MRAAIDFAVPFDAVADDFAAAMSATRRERVNGTFETIEHMHPALRLHLEALVIIISADFTFRHCSVCLSVNISYPAVAAALSIFIPKREGRPRFRERPPFRWR